MKSPDEYPTMTPAEGAAPTTAPPPSANLVDGPSSLSSLMRSPMVFGLTGLVVVGLCGVVVWLVFKPSGGKPSPNSLQITAATGASAPADTPSQPAPAVQAPVPPPPAPSDPAEVESRLRSRMTGEWHVYWRGRVNQEGLLEINAASAQPEARILVWNRERPDDFRWSSSCRLATRSETVVSVICDEALIGLRRTPIEFSLDISNPDAVRGTADGYYEDGADVRLKPATETFEQKAKWLG